MGGVPWRPWRSAAVLALLSSWCAAVLGPCDAAATATYSNACLEEGAILFTRTFEVCHFFALSGSDYFGRAVGELRLCVEVSRRGAAEEEEEVVNRECRALSAWSGHVIEVAIVGEGESRPGPYVASHWLEVVGTEDGWLVAAPAHVVPFTVAEAPLPHNKEEATVLAFYLGHDANVALLRGGVVLEALELERLTRERYYMPTLDGAEAFEGDVLPRALDGLLARAAVDAVDYVAWVRCHMSPRKGEVRRAVADALKRRGGTTQKTTTTDFAWAEAHHHQSHAVLGLYDAPFRRPLVVSLDGGGDDGYGLVLAADRTTGTLENLARWDVDLGTGYAVLSYYVSEVSGGFDAITAGPPGPTGRRLALAGKTMGYAALGRANESWVPALRRFYREHLAFGAPPPPPAEFWRRLGVTLPAGGDASAEECAAPPAARAHRQVLLERDLAATIQRVFEVEVVELVGAHLPSTHAFDGLVLAGGCALNVLANAALRGRFGLLDVWVPAAPNDGGLAVGAAWQVQPPPPSSPQALQYAGPPLFDDVEAALAALDPAAFDVERNVDAATAAAWLARNGSIVGVARGRTEFGPRALGHRSLLASPTGTAIRDRLNIIKHREFWRPCAPVLTEAEAARVFVDDVVKSPFMSFAHTLTEEAAAALPAIHHFDGTARPQTVSNADDPWLHALLVAVRRLTGWAVLINTSFNTRGRPILNTAQEALDLFTQDDSSMQALVLEDALITRRRRPEADS